MNYIWGTFITFNNSRSYPYITNFKLQMKKIKLLSLITTFALTFSLQSCGGGGGGGDNPGPTPTEDTTPPVATEIVPANNAIITIDGNSEGVINFSAKLADDVNLKSYSIEIHQNIDGHVEPKSISPRNVERVPYSFAKTTWTVEGKTATVSQTINIGPINNQAIQLGSYHFVLIVTDAAGNQQTPYINEIIFQEEP